MAAPLTVQLFYNPEAGSYSPRRLAELTKALENEGALVIATPSFDRLPVLAEQATHICVAGGDGTIRQVATILARSGRTLPIAIYPAGTVNLLAREGGFRRSPEACARHLLRGLGRQEHHPVELGETMFFACASAGPDSVAVAGISLRQKRLIGRLAYAFSFLRVLWKWPRPRLCLLADGRRLECEAVYVAKGRYFAGPWSFAPTASVAQRQMHVVALPTARRRDYFRFLWTLLRRRDPGRSRWAIGLTCTELELYSDDTFPVQADGDIVASCPVKLAIHSRSIYFH